MIITIQCEQDTGVFGPHTAAFLRELGEENSSEDRGWRQSVSQFSPGSKIVGSYADREYAASFLDLCKFRAVDNYYSLGAL